MSYSECVDVGVSISLLLFAHKPTYECFESISDNLAPALSNPYTNHFFKCAQAPYVGLVVMDHEIVRMLHAQLVSSGKMPYQIYFGYNTDPVEVVPLRNIVGFGKLKTCVK